MNFIDNLQLATFCNPALKYNITNGNQQRNILSIIHEHYKTIIITSNLGIRFSTLTGKVLFDKDMLYRVHPIKPNPP
jgi:hypothetical protein